MFKDWHLSPGMEEEIKDSEVGAHSWRKKVVWLKHPMNGNALGYPLTTEFPAALEYRWRKP